MYRITRTGFLALLALAFSASALAQYSQPVRDVENPGHAPFSASAYLELAPGQSSLYGASLTTVPSGKRVVIEYAAVACQTLGSDSISDFRIQIPRVINGVNSTIPAPLLVSRQGDSVSVFSVQKWAGGGPVKLYADFSNSYRIYFGFARTSALNEASCNVYVFGHTVNTQ